MEFIKRVAKRDEMRGLPNILFLFRNELNNFNNTGARMLDLIYHMKMMTLNYLKSQFLARKSQDFAIFT